MDFKILNILMCSVKKNSTIQVDKLSYNTFFNYSLKKEPQPYLFLQFSDLRASEIIKY